MSKSWGVVDLFSGAGGMSYGFRANPAFKMLAAVDFEIGKPSYGPGALECNQTYSANMGIEPINRDIAELSPIELEREIKKSGAKKSNVDVLISCAPCTGFSRTNSKNHVKDDPRNSLVTRSALFVEHFKPRIFLMENARELLRGNFTHHFSALQSKLESLGYRVHAQNYFLNQFGLPQKRERALVVATHSRLPLYSLDDLWDGFALKPHAMTVRRAIGHLPKLSAGERHPSDSLHVCPRFSDSLNLNRIAAIPHDGGSWVDLLRVPGGRKLLTPAMARSVAKKDFGSHPDVYGRLSWDKPAVTVKRECGHIGNGRYGHPEQDRLLSVREMSLIQGFPSDYVFAGRSISNMYRHIGDAVPPLVSFQLSRLCEWILGGARPSIVDLILTKTHLLPSDIVPQAAAQPGLPFSATG
jgi:DNA (cytosine-5)-methyltransferase 1